MQWIALLGSLTCLTVCLSFFRL